VRYSLVEYNLPVAANEDERMGLDLLIHLNSESLNPDFFNYPTFYYYLNLIIVAPLDNCAEILLRGRIFNLILSCCLSLVIFLLASRYLKSDIAGLIAAALTSFSPVLIMNASYITTDILMALLNALTLYFICCFLKTYKYRFWFISIVLAGLAISTKYNAAILAACIFIMDLIFAPELEANLKGANRFTALLNKKISTRVFSICLGAASLLLIASSQLPLDELFVSILHSEPGINSEVDSSDMLFISSALQKLLYSGVVVGLFALVCLGFPRFATRFTTIRPYAGIAIIATVFLAGTPFAIISFDKFIYDLGYEIKMNQMAGDYQFWTQYISWFIERECWLVLILAAVGVVYGLRYRRKYALLLILYLLFGYCLIGAARRGHLRYLTPMAPALYIFASYGLYSAGISLKKRFKVPLIDYAVVCACLIPIGLMLQPKISGFLSRHAQVEEMHHSYRFVESNIGSGKVYFSRYPRLPTVELNFNGIPVEELSYKQLSTGEFLSKMNDKDLLLVDRHSKSMINGTAMDALQLVWFSKENYYNPYLFKLK